MVTIFMLKGLKATIFVLLGTISDEKATILNKKVFFRNFSTCSIFFFNSTVSQRQKNRAFYSALRPLGNTSTWVYFASHI